MNKKIYILILLLFSIVAIAQERKDISEMTKEDVLELSYDELLEMPFEDVLKLAEVVGVSLEELYEMLLNKDVVSASKKVESSFEAPLSTSVVTYDEIVSSGARSIEEALRLVPGMIVREKTNGNFDVHIRGNDNTPPYHMFLYSENSITLVMINNRPVYNYAHGGTFWETLPIGIDDIDKIEVVRGPSSSLYGSNAVSGVVNIITKSQTSNKFNINANVQGGTQGTLISSLAIGQKISNKVSYRITGNFETQNRNTDELYVFKANQGKGSFITKDELAILPDYPSGAINLATYGSDINSLIQPTGDTNYYYRVFDPTDNINQVYPNPLKARERYGINGYLFWDIAEDIKLDLKGGCQNSEILSSSMGDNPSSMVGRLSSTGYVDFNANVKDFKAQVNVLTGWQDIIRADTGFKVDLMTVNANLEYDFHFGNLNIRPGFAYQLGKYNDMEYLRVKGQGFLNGEKEFNSTALSLRLDYIAFENLRLIGAIRGETYNTHKNPYLSYQLIASYNINDIHNLRIVHSRANRGPFLIDNYASFLWDREGRPDPGYILFQGKENLNLLTMNMFEIGYRVKAAKNIMIDLEAFMTKAKDFGALYPDSVNLNGALTGADRTWVRMSYNNINLESSQKGVTGVVSWVVNEDLLVKVFGTYQVTQLKNVLKYTQDGTIMFMLGLAKVIALEGGPQSSTSFPSDRKDVENLATPSFYGGAVISYKMLKDKLKLNLNSYFYSRQEFNNKYVLIDEDTQEPIPIEIAPKFVVNAKVSYNLIPQANVFINVRNALGAKREFAYMDEIGTIFTVGATFNY